MFRAPNFGLFHNKRLSSSRPTTDEPAGVNRRRRRDRQIRTDGKRQRVIPHSSSVTATKHADEHEPPRQVLAQQALDDRRHQRGLRRRDRRTPIVNTRAGRAWSADDERRRDHADDQPIC
jgi:hypothetical protein